MGDGQGDAGEQGEVRCAAEDSVDQVILVVPIVAEGIRTVRKGMAGAGCTRFTEPGGGHSLFRERRTAVQLGPERRGAVDTVQVHSKGGQWDQGKK